MVPLFLIHHGRTQNVKLGRWGNVPFVMPLATYPLLDLEIGSELRPLRLDCYYSFGIPALERHVLFLILNDDGSSFLS